MAERIKLFIQKRSSLKTQITTLSNALDRGKLDNTTLKLRIARVTELYHKFEENNDELMVLDPDDGHMAELSNIQERFYDLAGRIENSVNVAGTSGTSSDASSQEMRDNSSVVGTANTRRRMKLPQASLPTFDGKYENWLSFKNAFNNMVGMQSDLSDMDKLHYLQSALKGEAASKIKILAVEGISYLSAWKLLERSYEVKRILISRHLASIINSPVLDKESTSGLTKLADDAQQHIASLSSLGVMIGEEMVVHILENKLPKSTLEKWESTLDRDEFPKLEKMFEFLYKIAVCASRREKSKAPEGEPPCKKRREGSNRAFISNVTRSCIVCKSGRHFLYTCDKFKKLSVPERIELIKTAKLCFNCLRSHRGIPCKFSNCTICQRRHNSLLHLDKPINTPNTSISADSSK